MLRPQDTATRETKRLDGLWAFALDAGGSRARRRGGSPARSPDARDDGRCRPASTTSPPTPRSATTSATSGTSATVRVPRGWDGQRIVLHFESATHRATVWVGDTEVVAHEGGYTPFEADVTDARRGRASEVRVTVVRQQHADASRRIPPGVVEDTPDGQAAALLARLLQLRRPAPVGLAARPPRRPTSTTSPSSPASTAPTGTVDYRIEAVGADGPRRRGSSCATPTARRWPPAPGATGALDRAGRAPLGARRRLPLRPRGPAGRRRRRVRRRYHQSVGVRTVEVRGTEFLINGEPFYFTGLRQARGHRRHRQGPQRRATWSTTSSCSTGSAPTRSGRRTTPTPRTSSTTPTGTASCVIDETAAVGLNMGLGGGIFGGAGLHDLLARDDQRRAPARCTPRRSASSSPATRTTRASCCGPSPTSPSPTPRAPRTTSSRCSTWPARPTRPGRSGFVNVMLAPHGTCRVSQFADVLMLNRYYGWYVNTGDLAGAEVALDAGAARLGRARASRSSSPSTAPTPCPACTRSRRSRGARSTRSTTST